MTRPESLTSRRASAGFTLLELMFALVIIAIGLIALSGVQTRSSRDVYSTGRTTRALAVAQQHLETIRSVGYTAAVSDSGQDLIFAWTARVNPAGQDLKSIAITVTWPEQGQTRNVQLTTLLSSR